MSKTAGALTADDAYRNADPAAFDFATTDDVQPLMDGLGQPRAAEAIEFGIDIPYDGYNLFAFGDPGLGRHTLVHAHLEARAARLPAPDDWCYVNNLEHSRKPDVLRLPAGKARALREDAEQFVENLRVAIPAAFDSDDYRERRQAIEAEMRERQEAAFHDLHEQAARSDAVLVRTPMGLAIAPVAANKVIDPDTFRALPKKQQKKIRRTVGDLEKKLGDIVQRIPGWNKEMAEKIHELNRDVVAFAATHLIETLKTGYAKLEEVVGWLERIRSDIVDNAEVFWRDATEGGARQLQVQIAESPYERYRVNVIVDNQGRECAPVIFARQPTFSKLFGRIEHQSRFGNLVTDYRMIRGGALHRANGGFLVLDARDLLIQPQGWEKLKRALKSKQLEIESLAEALGYSELATLEPQPIPLDLKVVLIGDRLLYYLMSSLDPDVNRLFKAAVDFEDSFERKPDTEALFARFVAGLVRRNGLKPMQGAAVARLLEHASRSIGDSRRLSLDIGLIQDLMLEADHLASRKKRRVTTRAHVGKAIEARRRRLDRIHQRSIENIMRDIHLLETKGAVVGQINGLSVITLGHLSFGKPSRITAAVRLGRGEVIDIERQVELGGPLHSKGVMILSAFLGEKFGQGRPLAVSASLVFEQSYGGVDGDSASAAELFALLSALANKPVRQGLAVTGSVNQKGRVQAIGGVNQKIEGFFDICKKRGLRGRQGVLIPKSNVQHLMLREDVVAAIRRGSFRVCPIESIEQGIELLMGAPAGEPGADGIYPRGSVYRLVSARFDRFAAAARRHGFQPGGEAGKGQHP